MDYAIKGFLGLFKRIVYHCPACDNELESRMSEAGAADTCPMCGKQFEVPGAEERRRREAEAQEKSRAVEAHKAERAKTDMELRARAAEAIQREREGSWVASQALNVDPDTLPVGELTGPGDFAIEAVGESHYQDAIEAAIRLQGRFRCVVEALLILEDSNPHDSKAVKVQIGGRACGHLSRENARQYRKKLKEAGLPKTTFSCKARIVGKGPFGIQLDLPHDDSIESRSSWRDEPATARQREYADDLGIRYPKNITKGKLSDLISEATQE